MASLLRSDKHSTIISKQKAENPLKTLVSQLLNYRYDKGHQTRKLQKQTETRHETVIMSENDVLVITNYEEHSL